MMVLRDGDSGDSVKTLQRGLNRMGAMLLVDGDFGAGTRGAIMNARQELNRPGPPEADDDLQRAVAAVPDPFPPLTAAGMTFIAREEVSDAMVYQRRFQTPTCPPPPSGVTIGIGYDCRFVDRIEFRTDWGDVLPAIAVSRLEGVLGMPGTPEVLRPVATVVVPLAAAMQVFAKRTLPKVLALTRGIYPQIDDPAVTPAQRTALVSLVYNRGADLTGDRRREMRAIRDLLAVGRFDDVAAQLESMTRLWDPLRAGGLIQRRRDEATLWRSGFAAVQLD
jgi:peptidoglycan hydrolase-like protein with peptidoglycan-binding domain